MGTSWCRHTFSTHIPEALSLILYPVATACVYFLINPPPPQNTARIASTVVVEGKEKPKLGDCSECHATICFLPSARARTLALVAHVLFLSSERACFPPCRFNVLPRPRLTYLHLIQSHQTACQPAGCQTGVPCGSTARDLVPGRIVI